MCAIHTRCVPYCCVILGVSVDACNTHQIQIIQKEEVKVLKFVDLGEDYLKKEKCCHCEK